MRVHGENHQGNDGNIGCMYNSSIQSCIFIGSQAPASYLRACFGYPERFIWAAVKIIVPF